VVADLVDAAGSKPTPRQADSAISPRAVSFALADGICYAARMLASLREIFRYRSLLRDLVARDLKVRYKRSALGILWTMLNPLLLMIIFTIVFAQIFRVTVEHFAVYFLSAYVLWNFFAQATSWSTSCLLGYAPLIRKIYVPKSIFVLATVLAGLVNLLISLIPLALIMLVIGHPFSPAMMFLPVPIVLATMFSLGLSLALAPLSLMFNDIVQIYQAVLTAWMYLTPIMYPLSALPAGYRGLILANPMTHLVEAFRTPIYLGTVPSGHVMIAAIVAAVGTLLIGWKIFDHYSDRVAYYV
jgi:ABC-2 type transport system permease protein